MRYWHATDSFSRSHKPTLLLESIPSRTQHRNPFQTDQSSNTLLSESEVMCGLISLVCERTRSDKLKTQATLCWKSKDIHSRQVFPVSRGVGDTSRRVFTCSKISAPRYHTCISPGTRNGRMGGVHPLQGVSKIRSGPSNRTLVSRRNGISDSPSKTLARQISTLSKGIPIPILGLRAAPGARRTR